MNGHDYGPKHIRLLLKDVSLGAESTLDGDCETALQSMDDADFVGVVLAARTPLAAHAIRRNSTRRRTCHAMCMHTTERQTCVPT
jgi:hypothetical protein